MSLNGLDEAAVKEAHEAAVAEAGGWFLLKYASRDEVQLLARGTNGVVEMRSSVEQHDETSPLFGFLKYRRRNVLVKYTPEECSRLILARSTVHYNAVCERFGPCETSLEISDPKELNDVRLSNSFSLHTASARPSSSNSSLRRRRLMEIAEEGEEDEQRETKRQSVELSREKGVALARSQSPPIAGPPVKLDSSVATWRKESKFADTTNAPSFAGVAVEVSRPASPAKSFDADTGRRMSSQSSRQEYDSSSSHLHLPGKTRVKLGPRPSADPVGRPPSSGDTKRPVASMPAGLKLLLKGGKKAKTQDDASSIISEGIPENAFLASAPPSDISRPHTSGGRPPSSSGISVKSLPATSAPTKQAMTPEKLRLMKALQLREKKRRASATPVPSIPSVEVTPSPAVAHDEMSTAAVEEGPSVQVTATSSPAPPEEPAVTVDSTEAAAAQRQPLAEEETKLATNPPSVSKADSAIDVVSTAPTDQTSEHTRTDSRPPSPVCCASDVGGSTNASSVSESTEETIHAAAGGKENGEWNKVEEGESQAQQAGEQIAGVSAPGAEAEKGNQVADAASVQEQGAPKAVLSQTEQNSDVEAEQSPGVKAAEAEEPDGVANGLDAHLAQGNLIPTSKFAAKMASGQAVMIPSESRGPDPLNVANVASEPGRIDEADPAPVETAERTQDGSSSSPSDCNLPISKYSSTHSTSTSPARSPAPDTVTPLAEKSPNGPESIGDAADKMVDDGTTDEKRRSEPPAAAPTSSPLPAKEPPQQSGDATGEPQAATSDDAGSMMAMSPVDDAGSMMAMSPVTATPPQPSQPPTPRTGMLRTVSTPVHSELQTAADAPPSATPSRSMSSGSAFHQRLNQQPPPSTHMAPGRQPSKLGGSLASRIKAFEQLAIKAPVAAAPVVSSVKDRPSSAFFSVQRNKSVREGPRSPSVLERTSSIYGTRTPTPSDYEDSPDSVAGSGASVVGSVAGRRDRSGSVASRMSVFEGGSAPRGRPETVQVTARIVRDPGQRYPRGPESNADASEYASLDLKQSPLIVDHRKDVETPNPTTPAEVAPIPTPLVHAGGESRRSLHERRLSRDQRKSIDYSKDGPSRPGQRTSLHMARDFFRDSMTGKEGRPSSIHLQSNSFFGRLSVNTKRMSNSQDSSLRSPASTSIAELSENGDEKREGTRTKRLMRRLSSTFSPGRKHSTASTMTSPTLAEEDAYDPETTPRAATAPPGAHPCQIVACMGDVNVQFPENLLWKRRTMSLDSNGFLHLSPSQGTTTSRERQLKRFHLSEFKLPYTPEMEFQELPNSVCLDFKTGSGLQIALQDRIGQQNVLLVLQNAHNNHPSFGQ